MNDIEQLFIDTVNELSERMTRGSRYDLIKASGLIRALVVDGSNLMHQVNRNFREKILFTVKQWQTATPAPGKLELQTVMPTGNGETIAVELDAFLVRRCIFYHQHVYTVRDIIKVVANVRGGVHAGKPSTDSEAAVVDPQFVSLKVGVAGTESVDLCIGQIKAIAEVVLSSLRPLKSRILRSN